MYSKGWTVGRYDSSRLNLKPLGGRKRARPASLSSRIVDAGKRLRPLATYLVNKYNKPKAPPVRFDPWRGRYAGLFGRVKHNAVSYVAKNGYHFRQESGGVVTDANCLYIMQTASGIRPLLEGICCGIWKRIMQKWGKRLSDWNNEITGFVNDEFRAYIYYKLTPNGGISNTAGTAILGNQSHLNMAQLIGDLIMSVASATDVYFEVTTIRVYWRRVTPDEYIEEMDIDPYRCKILVDAVAKMSVQNRTPAATGAADETNALDVSNNPVHGKLYYGVGTMIAAKSQNSGVGNTFLSALANNGFSSVGVAAANMPADCQKPQPYYCYNKLLKDKNIYIQPGDIKTAAVKYKKKLTLQGYIKFLFNFIRSASTLATGSGSAYVGIPCMMIGLERMVDTRTSEPDLQIGYEANVDLKVVAFIDNTYFTTPRIL